MLITHSYRYKPPKGDIKDTLPAGFVSLYKVRNAEQLFRRTLENNLRHRSAKSVLQMRESVLQVRDIHCLDKLFLKLWRQG